MSDIIKILFYVRKSKTNSKGLSPIYMRVTIGGQRFETGVGRYIEMCKWSQKAGKANGNSSEAKEINGFLDVLRAKAFGIQKQSMTIGLELTSEEFARQWHGLHEK